MRSKVIVTVALILAVVGLAAATGTIGRIERWMRRDSTIDVVYTATVSGQAIVRWVDGDVQLHQETFGSTDSTPVTKEWRVQVPAHNNLSALSVTPQSADSWGRCRSTLDDPEGSPSTDEHTVHGNQASAVCTIAQIAGGAPASDDATANLLASATKDGALLLTNTSLGGGFAGPLELGREPIDSAKPDWPAQLDTPAHGRMSVVVVSSVPDNTLRCSIEVDGKSVSDAKAAAVGEMAVCTYKTP